NPTTKASARLESAITTSSRRRARSASTVAVRLSPSTTGEVRPSAVSGGTQSRTWRWRSVEAIRASTATGGCTDRGAGAGGACGTTRTIDAVLRGPTRKTSRNSSDVEERSTTAHSSSPWNPTERYASVSLAAFHRRLNSSFGRRLEQK